MATEQPKKPMTGFFLFLTEKRASIVSELGDQAKVRGMVSKTGGDKWRAFSVAEKAPFEKKAAAAKADYDKAVAKFKASGGEIVRKRKADKNGKKPKKDKNAPKKPAGGGYGVYVAEHRAEIVKSLPAGSNKITDVSKKAGERWKALSADQKKPYEDKFHLKQKEYGAAMIAYKIANPEKKDEAQVEEDEEEEAEDGDDEDDDEDEEEEEEQEKPVVKRAKGNDAAVMKKPAATTANESEANVTEEAKKLGYAVKFKTISENPKFASISKEKVLNALKGADGSVIAAKTALLGA